MPKSFSSSRNTGLTAVGLAMFVGFAALGLGWSRIEAFVLGQSKQLEASSPNAKEVIETDSGLVKGVETDQSMERLTPEEEERNRLADLSQTHAINAWECLDKKRYWKAISEAKEAIKIDPQNFDAYDVRDRAFKKLGIRRKKQQVVIQGAMCDVRTGSRLPAGLTGKEGRELMSADTDMFGMAISDTPMGGL